MPQMEYDGQSTDRANLLALVYDPDAQVVVFQRPVEKIFIAAIYIEKKLPVKAEIAPPHTVIGYGIAVH